MNNAIQAIDLTIESRSSMKDISPTLLTELVQHQTDPSISIICSTELTSFSDKEKIRLSLKNQIDQVAKKLSYQCEPDEARKLTNAVEAVAKEISLDRLEKGIGMYVSSGFQTLVSFPFPVRNKAIVSSHFDVSDIEHTIDKLIPYRVLLLSKNKTRLFKGKGNKLEEVEDQQFPRRLGNDFQTHRTSPHSFYNEEESEVDQSRLESDIRKIDKQLDSYGKDTPIVLLGVVKHLSTYKKVTKHTKLIISSLTGNYDQSSTHQIAELVWPQVEGAATNVNS